MLESKRFETADAAEQHLLDQGFIRRDDPVARLFDNGEVFGFVCWRRDEGWFAVTGRRAS